MRPSTQVPNNDTNPSTLPEHGKVPGILVITFLTQYSFHQDFSEVYKHFHEELVTGLFTLPGYTGLISCTGGVGIHQQTPVFMYFRSPTVFPADLAEMWKVYYKGNCVLNQVWVLQWPCGQEWYRRTDMPTGAGAVTVVSLGQTLLLPTFLTLTLQLWQNEEETGQQSKMLKLSKFL